MQSVGYVDFYRTINISFQETQKNIVLLIFEAKLHVKLHYSHRCSSTMKQCAECTYFDVNGIS